MRGSSGSGASVAVRGREVLHRLASDEVVFEPAVDDDIDGLRGNAFVVDLIGADEAVAIELRLERIVGDAHELGQNAGVVAGGVGSAGAGGGAEVGAVGLDVADEEAVEDVGGGVAGEEDGAVIVLGVDDGSFAEVVEALEVVDDALAEGGPALELGGADGDGAVVARDLHAVGGLATDADGVVVSAEAVAEDGSLGVDEVTIERHGADVGGGVLDLVGEGADLGRGGVEAAGLDDALLPLVAVDLELAQRLDVDDRLFLREVLLGALGLEALHGGQLGGVGAEGVLVGLVGRGPEGVAEGGGVVVLRGELDGAVAAAAAGVDGVVADADGDADDALAAFFFAGKRSVGGDRLVAGEVVEPVLDEVRGAACRGARAGPFRGRARPAWP